MGWSLIAEHSFLGDCVRFSGLRQIGHRAPEPLIRSPTHVLRKGQLARRTTHGSCELINDK